MSWIVDRGWPATSGARAQYRGAPNADSPAGLRYAPKSCTVLRGRVNVRVRFELGLPGSQARIVFGRDSNSGAYLCAGLGGYDAAYVVDEWLPRQAVLRPLQAIGEKPAIAAPCELELGVTFHGRRVAVEVDSGEELSTVLPRTLGRSELGLFAWGHETITFSDLTVDPEPPHAFVAMQFEGYEEIFEHVITRPLRNAGVWVDRVDKYPHPTNILEDIRSTIRDADVVVAEITPGNENVFYEVGYAHACGAPTILLVQRDRELPFDVRPERCIVYDDTPEGRRAAGKKIVSAVKAMRLV
jgi:hypothetical protein